MNRIQISTSSDGSDPYTLPINPQDVNLQDSMDIVKVDVLDGAAVYQQSTFDSRPRSLIWQGVSAHSSGAVSVYTMVSSVRSWIGEVRYFNFQDLEIINQSWPVDNMWKKCRIIDLQGKIKPSSYFVYSSLELIIQPEQ